MDLSKILSVSGKPGLYRMVGEAKNNLIIESLLDGKKIPSFAHDRVSSLKEISIYTEGEDTPLEKVFEKVYNHQEGKPVDDPKKMSNQGLKSIFEAILPDYDKESVYTSDMKKVFVWYNLLLEKGLLDFSESTEGETEKEEEKKETTEQE
ncbi:MAG: DUF5606 domain-containing protein [Bacteroidetes bacterium]|nr:DUF5606 domain-containing protein [Bacteroidota bacterium]